MNLPRLIEPEWLDDLPPEDPRALRSRGDLRRLNFIMGNAGILRWQLLLHHSRPATIVELGAGDGTFMLALARRLGFGPTNAILVDRMPNMSEKAQRALEAMGWSVEYVAADVFDWLAKTDQMEVTICNLFLHHLPPQALASLLAGCAAKTSLFLACEPARTRLALYGSHLLGLIGCNDVTQHDAVVSVHAGFRRQELSKLWPDKQVWLLEEHGAGLFSHIFAARRK
jgi:2-polyprenyl-3-methyl-5-hydroxy-6-metoxy-1,4-benzoquinol methylase